MKRADSRTGVKDVRILLVDDSPHDRGLVRRELRKEFESVEFVEVTNQLEFEDVLVEGGFDLVITDYRIRWTTGLQILAVVKKRFPTCPILMFTATGTEEIAAEAMKAGLDDYIIKNANHLVKLRAAVRSAIDNARVRREADLLASRLETLLTQLEVGTFSCTLSGKITNANGMMASVLNCTSPKESNTELASIGSLFACSSDAERFLKTVLQSNRPCETEIDLVNPNGVRKVYRLSAKHIAEDMNAPHIDGLFEDITLRKQHEQETKEAVIAATRISMLSPREHEVFEHVVSGRPNKAIANQMQINIKTVEKHRASVMKKLGVHTLVELVRLATLVERAKGVG